MRQTSIRIGVSAALPTFAMLGVLLTPGSASAGSRGFVLKNDSSKTVTLEAVKPVETEVCVDSTPSVGKCTIYQRGYFPIDFEGRPADGTKLGPRASMRFELKYGSSLPRMGDPQYAAGLFFKTGTNGHGVEYVIETYISSNESFCKVTPVNTSSCTAQSLNLAYK